MQVYGDNDEKIATLLPGTLIGEVRNVTYSDALLILFILTYLDI